MIALTCCIYLYRLLSIDFLFTGSHMPSLGLKMHWSKSSVKSPDSNRSLRLHPRTATFEYQLQSYAFSRLLWMLSLRGETCVKIDLYTCTLFMQHFTIRLLDWYPASQPKISTNSIYTEECCTPDNSQIVVLAHAQESICLSSSTQVILGIRSLLAKFNIFQQLWASERARNAFLLSAQGAIIQFYIVQLTYCGQSGMPFKDFCGAGPESKLTYMHTVHAALHNSFARLILGCSTQNPQFWPRLKKRFACHLQFKIL